MFLKGTDFHNESVLFQDKNGDFCNKECDFSEHFNKVIITTNQPQKYNNYAELSLKKFGSSPIIKPYNSQKETTEFIVDFFTKKFFINSKNLSYNYLDFNDNNIVMPNVLLDAIPDSIGVTEFCSGLLKYYDLPELNSVYYNP